MKAIWIGEDEACYGRNKVICIGNGVCNVCRERKTCMTFDHSDEEYGEIAICAVCIGKAFEGKPLKHIPEDATALPGVGEVKP